ncbi:ATP-binding protein [Myxococcus sp. Y35]|uniref:ATP-binding protein n=1 Tax=Pseudomyxococcus flavus TaxID=3115648 RepID=UPI003CF635F1
MTTLPITLVFRSTVPPALQGALDAAGFPWWRASASEAAQSVRAGWAQVVICEQVPGWQALVAQIESVRGAAILWGPPPAQDDGRRLLPSSVETLEDAALVREAVERAEARRRARLEPRSDTDLLARHERAERVSHYAQSIASQATVSDLVAEAMSCTRDLCDADGAVLLLVDRATGDLEFQPRWPGSRTAPRIRRRPGEGIAGQVARDARSMRVTSERECTELGTSQGAVTGVVPGSVIAVPLLFAGDVIGVLEAVRGVERPVFSARDLECLEHLSPYVSIAVHNAQLWQELYESRAEVLQANARLEEKVRQRTEQISKAQREWVATFDSIGEPVALQDGFTVRRANLAYARRAGVSVTELGGRKCHELLARQSTPCAGCPLAETPEAALSGDIALPDGTLFAFHGFKRLDTASSREVVVHYRDITAERRLESKLRESERLAAVGQLASGAAHEINNPLAFMLSNLRNLSEYLQEMASGLEPIRAAARALSSGQCAEAGRALSSVDLDSLDWNVRDGLELIAESLTGGERVGSIVRSLRELSRLEITRSEQASVNDSVIRAARKELGDTTDDVVLELASKARARLSPLHLDQALGHVLRNARQAVKPGQHIFVRTRDEEQTVVVEVQDEGRGIAPEHLGRVFDPFFTTGDIGQSVGLGLTATYGIVSRSGGTIAIRSQLNEGTTVRIELPMERSASAAPTTVQEPGSNRLTLAETTH